MSTKVIEDHAKDFLESAEKTENVYQRLVSRRHSREDPANPAKLGENLYSGDPNWPGLLPPFIGLWGGSKDSSDGVADLADSAVLDKLYMTFFDSTARLVHLHDGSEPMASDEHYNVYLIFCDSHHIIANGIEPEASERYYASLVPVVKSTQQRVYKSFIRNLDNPGSEYSSYLLRDGKSENFHLIRLSDIFDETGGMRGVIPNQIADGYAVSRAQELLQNTDLAHGLVDAAKKHSKLPCDPEKAALIYASMEISFLRLLEDYKTRRFGGVDFRNGIFFSYSNPEVQRPIAEAAGVPMLFFHSFGDRNDVPWYFEMKE